MMFRAKTGLVCLIGLTLIGLTALACGERAAELSPAASAEDAAVQAPTGPAPAAEPRVVRNLPPIALREPAGDPSDPSGLPRLTAAELEAAGRHFVGSFEWSGPKIDALIDRDRLAARALPKRASERDRGEARKQAGYWKIRMLAHAGKAGSRAELVGVRSEGPISTAVVRTRVLDDVDYLELILERSPSGEAKLVDVFRHRLGLYESDRVRQAVGHGYETGAFGQFASRTRETLRLAVDKISKDPRAALAQLRRLPVGVNTSREIVLLRWAVASGNGLHSIGVNSREPVEPEYTDELRTAIRTLDDSSLGLARLDLALREGELSRALTEMEGLRTVFGGDPTLEIANAQLEWAAGQAGRAQAQLERSLAADDEPGHWTGLAIYLAAGDTVGARRALQQIEGRFAYALGEDASPALDRIAQRWSEGSPPTRSLGALLTAGPRLRRELGAELASSAPDRVVRYRDASGHVRFVADRSDLPAGHEPLDPAAPSSSRTPAPADAPLEHYIKEKRAVAAVHEREAETWRQRRRKIEQTIQRHEEDIARLDTEVGRACDRTTDGDGRRHMRDSDGCSAVRLKRELARQELAWATEELHEGLPEKCRRAGCEPGWIR